MNNYNLRFISNFKLVNDFLNEGTPHVLYSVVIVTDKNNDDDDG